jgi:glycine cleavage system aminomethyltransferase T
MSALGTLHRTARYDTPVALGATIVPFAGFEMPVPYPVGITAAHHAVRKSRGLFDVSHMGAFLVTGPGAIAFVNFVTTNDVSKLAIGQAHYSTFCNERGRIEDDCLVLYFAEEHSAARWAALMSDGDATPAGRGAGDTLRREMGMARCGSDIDDTVTPYDANLAWLVQLTAKQ